MGADRGKFVRDLMRWQKALYIHAEFMRDLKPPDEFKEQYEEVHQYVRAAVSEALEAYDAIDGLLKAMGEPTRAERIEAEFRAERT